MATDRPLIALVTDFGLQDPFVGVMKGVIASIAPQAHCIDVTHHISPHDIEEGMFVLKAAYRYFPLHTVFLVVVDPGVGSQRRPLLVVTEQYRFVAPDNGILTPIYQDEPSSQIYEITAKQYFLDRISTTFHGRDIFAPVAAWLLQGVEPQAFGPQIFDPVFLPLPSPQWINHTTLRGTIIYIDRFGNLITNLSADLIEDALRTTGAQQFFIHFRSYKIARLCSSYAEQKEGELGALLNSWGFLELFVKQQNAQQILQAQRGEAIHLFFSPEKKVL